MPENLKLLDPGCPEHDHIHHEASHWVIHLILCSTVQKFVSAKHHQSGLLTQLQRLLYGLGKRNL